MLAASDGDFVAREHTSSYGEVGRLKGEKFQND